MLVTQTTEAVTKIAICRSDMKASRKDCSRKPHILLEDLRGMVALRGRDKISRGTVNTWINRLNGYLGADIRVFKVLGEDGKYRSAMSPEHAEIFVEVYCEHKWGNVSRKQGWKSDPRAERNSSRPDD